MQKRGKVRLDACKSTESFKRKLKSAESMLEGFFNSSSWLIIDLL